MNNAHASSPAADSKARPPVRSEIHGTDTLVPSINGDYQRGMSALWCVLRMALHYRVRFPAAVLAVIATGGFQLLIPLYLGVAIDQALGLMSGAKTDGATMAQAESALVTSALLVLGIAVMRGVFTASVPATSSRVACSTSRACGASSRPASCGSSSSPVPVGLGACLYMGQDLVLGLLCVSFVPFVRPVFRPQIATSKLA